MAFTASSKQQAVWTAASRGPLNNKLWNFVVGEIQREVFAGSFDWKSILDVDTLLSQAAAAVEAFRVGLVLCEITSPPHREFTSPGSCVRPVELIRDI